MKVRQVEANSERAVMVSMKSSTGNGHRCTVQECLGGPIEEEWMEHELCRIG